MERPPHNDERQGEPGQIIRFPRQWVPLDGIQPLDGDRDEAESSDRRGSAGTETLVADFWDTGDTQEFVAGSEAATARPLKRGEGALRVHLGGGSDVANRSERRRIVAFCAVAAVVAIAAGAAALGRNLILPGTGGTSTPTSAWTAQRTTAASHETTTRGVLAASNGSASRRRPAQRQRKRVVRHKRGVTDGRRSAPVPRRRRKHNDRDQRFYKSRRRIRHHHRFPADWLRVGQPVKSGPPFTHHRSRDLRLPVTRTRQVLNGR